MSQPPSHNAKARKKLRVSHTCKADESDTELKKRTERPSRKNKPSLHIELTHFRAELSHQYPPISSDGIRNRAEHRQFRPTPSACCRPYQSIPDRTHFDASVDVTGAVSNFDGNYSGRSHRSMLGPELRQSILIGNRCELK